MEGIDISWNYSGNKMLLLPDEIIVIIMDYLKENDLKSCRLVCKRFNSAVLSSSSWTRTVCVKMSFTNLCKHTYKKFLKNSRRIRRSGCLRNLPKKVQIACPNMHYFVLIWMHWGPLIKSLELTKSTFQSVDDFRDVVFRRCPNMEKLTLSNVRVRDARIVSEPTEWQEPEHQFGGHRNLKSLTIRETGTIGIRFGISFMELFSHFPNLESLTINTFEDEDNFRELVTIIARIRSTHPSKLKLKHVNFMESGWTTAHFSAPLLKDPGFALQTIRWGQICDSKTLLEVIELHAPSLEKLYLNNGLDRLTTLCPLKSLRELGIGNEVFSSLSILKSTPNLTRLVIHDSLILQNTDYSNMEGMSLQMCKQLILKYKVEVDVLRNLTKWLPRVIQLKLEWVTNAHFQVICENWPSLVTFVSTSGTLDDSGITGLDDEDVKRIHTEGESISWRPVTVPRANIAVLRDLKNLHLDGRDDNDRSTKLGFCAMECGIELLPRLEALDLEHYDLYGATWININDQFWRAKKFLDTDETCEIWS